MPTTHADRPFVHHALDHSSQQIRLFRFRHAKGLELTLTSFEIDKAPEYVAFSYEWGEVTWTHVPIDGNCLRIRQNLLDFLAHIRQPEVSDFAQFTDTWIWADQICISQQDDDEKSQQVALMGQIYRNAQRVIVWLGKCTAHLYYEPKFDLTALETTFDYVSEASYWSRLWIVQELLLARELYIVGARRLISFDRYVAKPFQGWIDPRLPSVSETPYYTLIIDRAYSKSRKVDLTLFAALNKYAHLQCEDRRDKIFGLLNIVRSDQRIAVKYDMEADEVAYSVVKALPRHGQTRWFNTHITLTDHLYGFFHDDLGFEGVLRETINKLVVESSSQSDTTMKRRTESS